MISPDRDLGPIPAAIPVTFFLQLENLAWQHKALSQAPIDLPKIKSARTPCANVISNPTQVCVPARGPAISGQEGPNAGHLWGR